jgi:hypothetical protein
MRGARRLGAAQICLAGGISLLAGGMLASSAAAGSGDRAQAKPALVQVAYEESDDGTSAQRQLSAFAQRADSVTFAVRIHRERVVAGSKLNTHVVDTDLHGDAKHPWVLSREGAGKEVLGRIHDALRKNGDKTVWVRADGASGVDKRKVSIVLSECTLDPPFYPVSCQIGL